MNKKIQANVDSQLAMEAETVLSNLGLNMTSAINIFLKQVVATGSIPFPLKESEAQKAERELFQALSKLPIKEAHSREEVEEWLNED